MSLARKEILHVLNNNFPVTTSKTIYDFADSLLSEMDGILFAGNHAFAEDWNKFIIFECNVHKEGLYYIGHCDMPDDAHGDNAEHYWECGILKDFETALLFDTSEVEMWPISFIEKSAQSLKFASNFGEIDDNDVDLGSVWDCFNEKYNWYGKHKKATLFLERIQKCRYAKSKGSKRGKLPSPDRVIKRKRQV